jgi:hypothetical protein
MAFNGTGTFVRIYNWVQDKANSIKITASRMDTEMDGFATGLSNCIVKDGQTSGAIINTPTINTPTINTPTINTPTISGLDSTSDMASGVQAYVNATLQNSWALSGKTPAYYKDPFGLVRIDGAVTGGTNSAAAFTLPSGYRPAFAVILVVVTNAGAAQITINTNGTVVMPASGSTVSLYGISFRAA